jgi:hypothetical protein
MKLKATVITLTAALGLSISVSGVKAGTLEEDFDAGQTQTKAVNAELAKAEAAIYLGGVSAAMPQIKTAINHAQADIDRTKAILHRGVDQCLADHEHYQERAPFWIAIAQALKTEQEALNELKEKLGI